MSQGDSAGVVLLLTPGRILLLCLASLEGRLRSVLEFSSLFQERRIHSGYDMQCKVALAVVYGSVRVACCARGNPCGHAAATTPAAALLQTSDCPSPRRGDSKFYAPALFAQAGAPSLCSPTRCARTPFLRMVPPPEGETMMPREDSRG